MKSSTYSQPLDLDQSTSKFKMKLADYLLLIKLRLNLTVVFSTALGYGIGANGTTFSWVNLLLVIVGGFCTVSAANAINQMIEKDSDSLMIRTENRPIVQGRISLREAGISSIILGTIGFFLLYKVSVTAATLSLISLILYGFAYTPLKKITPLSVHVGAIPGSLPPLIGYIASGHGMDGMALLLFGIQFLWQFPHFYAIAWLLKDDYSKAGLKMYPIGSKSDLGFANQTLFYTLLPIGLFLWAFSAGLIPIWVLCALLAIQVWFGYKAWNFKIQRDNLSSKKLMFASFAYLPLAIIVLLLKGLF